MLDGIEYVYVDDSAVALEAYRAGDLDIVQIEPPQIPEVQADPELSEAFVTYPLAATYNLEMNLAKEPFTDKKVRRRSPTRSTARRSAPRSAPATAPDADLDSRRALPGAIETDKYGFDPEAAVQALAESSYGGPEGLPEIKIYLQQRHLRARRSKRSGSPVRYRDILGVELDHRAH